MEEHNSITVVFLVYSLRMAHIISSLPLILLNKMVGLNESIAMLLKLV